MEWHPFAEKFPLLQGDEWSAFKNSIERTRGNIFPVLYRTVDGAQQGLDGRNRFRACEELGLHCRMEELYVADEEVVDFILDRNVHRRHMTRELRQELVAELRGQGKSTREIAERLGVNDKTVRNDLRDSGAEKSAPDTITGRDGKTYPSRAERLNIPQPQRPSILTDDDQEQPAGKTLRDAAGNVVPAQAVLAFERAELLSTWGREVDALLRMLSDILDGPVTRLIDHETIKLHFRNGKMGVLQNRATHVCPLCFGRETAGPPCVCCKGDGWTAEHVYVRLTTEKGKR